MTKQISKRRSFRFIFVVIFIIVATLFFPSTPSFAKGGKLKKFEQKLERKPSRRSTYRRGGSRSSIGTAELITRTWWETLSLFMLAGIYSQGIGEDMSMSEQHRALRAMDSPLLPTIKLEGNYQYIVNHIHGYDATLTVGYMMFAADCNVWHLFESDPDDQLKFISPHLLIRFAPFGFMQIDLAFGSKIIIGDKTHHGFEAGLPAYFFFSRNLIWDVKTYGAYINGRDLWDVSSGLNFRIKYVGIRAGYRMIELDGDYTHGPQVGIFGQW